MALLHFHPCSSFRQEQLWVRVLTVGWQPHLSLVELGKKLEEAEEEGDPVGGPAVSINLDP